MSNLLKSVVFIYIFLMSSFSLAQENQNVRADIFEDNWPENRFSVGDDGTVTDMVTDLMWKQCPIGTNLSNNACQGEPQYINWAEAHSIALAADYAGYNDWRVPNIKELVSIVAFARVSPALNLDAFPNVNAADNSQIMMNYIASNRLSEWNSFRQEFVKNFYMLDTSVGFVRRKEIPADPSTLKLGLLLVRQK